MNTHDRSFTERIHDFVEGNLSSEEVDLLWAELMGRPDDLDYLQTLLTLKKMRSDGKIECSFEEEEEAIITPLHTHQLDSEPTLYEKFKPYLVAASVIIIGFMILFNLMTDIQTYQNDDPISMIEYEIERSADNQTMLDSYLQEAVNLAINGDLEAAYAQIDEASSLELTENQVIELKMVKGAIEYNTQNYTDALQTFREINSTQNIDEINLEKGTWYLANTQLQLGLLNEAVESMERVIELDGSFSRVAKNKLKALQQPPS